MIGILYKEIYIYICTPAWRKEDSRSSSTRDGCQGLGHGSLCGQAIPIISYVGGQGHFEMVSSAVWGGVLEWLVMSWVSFWLAWSAGAVLCVDRDEVMVEFREVVKSVFSSAFLEGLPVKGSDHQVHT